jgi:hypothetical protein
MRQSPFSAARRTDPMKKLLLATAAAAALFSAEALAGSILIVNGSSITSEPDTTTSITTQLSNLHIAAGNTVTIADTVPGSFAGFNQIWDIRFSNAGAMTGGEQAQYLAFLQSGGGMFVMGENSFFTSRNSSVLALIDDATGDSLTFTTPDSTQTVLAPFTGPNTIAGNIVSYSAPGGVTSPGTTGQYISVDGSGDGTGVAWGVGDMANASAGALTAIFDVNFMQTDANAESQALLRNLISFVDVEVNETPEPASLLIFGVGIAALAARRRRA